MAHFFSIESLPLTGAEGEGREGGAYDSNWSFVFLSHGPSFLSLGSEDIVVAKLLFFQC